MHRGGKSRGHHDRARTLPGQEKGISTVGPPDAIDSRKMGLRKRKKEISAYSFETVPKSGATSLAVLYRGFRRLSTRWSEIVGPTEGRVAEYGAVPPCFGVPSTALPIVRVDWGLFSSA